MTIVFLNNHQKPLFCLTQEMISESSRLLHSIRGTEALPPFLQAITCNCLFILYPPGLSSQLFWLRNMFCISFFTTAVTNFHKFSCLKQHKFIIYQFCGLGVCVQHSSTGFSSWNFTRQKLRCLQDHIFFWRLWKTLFPSLFRLWAKSIPCCCGTKNLIFCWMSALLRNSRLLLTLQIHLQPPRPSFLWHHLLLHVFCHNL